MVVIGVKQCKLLIDTDILDLKNSVYINSDKAKGLPIGCLEF